MLAALVQRINDKRAASHPWSDDFYARIADLAISFSPEKPEGLRSRCKRNYRYLDAETQKVYSILKSEFKD